MDTSSGSSLSTDEATQRLKDMLNVGKSLGLSTDSSLQTTSDAFDNTGDGDTRERIGSSTFNGTSSQPLPSDGNGDSDLAMPIGTGSRSVGEIASRQQILLQGNDRTGSVPVYAKDVTIVESEASSVANSTAGSNKVRISPVVNYDWEHKYYTGNLVAINNTYIAYALKGRTGYVVRVIDRNTSERVLLKGFVGVVIDLAFGHLNSNTLACIDEQGNLFVWDLFEQDGKITTVAKITVHRPANTPSSEHHRLIWCPYIPEDPSDSSSTNDTSNPDDSVRMLAITHNEKAEVWDIEVVAANHDNGPISMDEIKEGVISVNGHDQPISQAALSPDGAVLATASLDGNVKFWQVYLESSDPPRRLHQWIPHDNRPVSCLLFCDNHKYQDPNLPFWRFLLTGADYNREIKVWCTVSWTCLQTLNFTTPSPMQPEPCLKACLDLSAGYLVMSDIKRKVLYVLEVFQDIEKGHAHISSISEFLLTQPLLSFAILDASRKKFKHVGNEEADMEDDAGDLDVSRSSDKDSYGTSSVGVVIKMYCVHTKSLQELQIRFQPQSSIMAQIAASLSSVSQDEIGVRDPLSDLDQSTDVEGSQADLQVTADDDGIDINDEEDEQDQAPTPTPGTSMTSSFTSDSARSPHQHPVLLPPDAFTTTTPKQSPSQLVRESQSSTSSLTAVSGMNSSVDDLLSTSGSHDISESTITLTPSSHRKHDGSEKQTPTSLPLPPTTPGETDQSQEIDILELEKSALEDELKESVSTQSENVLDFSNEQSRMDKRDSSSSIELVANGASRDDNSPEIEIVPEPQEGVEDTFSGQPTLSVQQSQEELAMEDSVKVSEEESLPSERSHPESQPDSSRDTVSEQPIPLIGVGPAANQADLHGNIDDDIIAGVEESSKGSQADSEPVLESVSDTQLSPQVVPEQETSDRDNLEVSSSLSSTSSTPGRDKSQRRDLKKERKSRSSPKPRKLIESDSAAAELSAGLKQLQSILQAQQEEIKQLRQDVQKHQLNNSLVQSMKSKMDSLERRLGNKIDVAISQQAGEEKQRLELALQERQSLDKQKQEKLLETVSQTLSTTVTQKLEKTVRTEMKTTVLPALNRIVDPVKDQLHQTVSQKLTATDTLMKENISKLVRSRSTTEAIGQAAANTVQNAMQSTYKETFQSTVVPAFDKACHSMFQQVNETFQSGTQEYVQQLESHLQKRRQQIQEGRDPVVDKLQSMVDSFQASSTQIRNSIISSVQAELDNQLQKSMASLQGSLVSKVRDIVKDEVNHAMKDHQAVVESSIVNAITRSSAATPVPQQIDTQQLQLQIVQLLQQGHYNHAFQTALSASDLNLVVFVCQSIQPQQVFGVSPCPLAQPVILSLIQQLSADLESDTELKHRYLQEAVMNLETTDPVTREHVPGVIMGLLQKIEVFMQNYTQSEHTRPLRMLSMAAKSLLK
ncbi:enhancer of mRNA-decapping protein 4-like [Glandiceps talaboti]